MLFIISDALHTVYLKNAFYNLKKGKHMVKQKYDTEILFRT